MPYDARLKTLKAQREAAGLSVTELARQANVSERTIFQIEDGGDTSVEAAERLCTVLATAAATPAASAPKPSRTKAGQP